MATGSGQDISVSSPYIVTDGLEHSVTLSTGVGRLSLAVDDDITRQVESRAQPGLGNDANVFVGGQPGGDYSGYSGCIDSLSVLVTANLEPPDWSLAVRVDFTGTTILYGNYECGVCRLREAGGQQQSDLGEVWGEVSELPRPLSSLPSLSSLQARKSVLLWTPNTKYFQNNSHTQKLKHTYLDTLHLHLGLDEPVLIHKSSWVLRCSQTQSN